MFLHHPIFLYMKKYIFQYTFPNKENKGRLHGRTYVVYCAYDMKSHMKLYVAEIRL